MQRDLGSWKLAESESSASLSEDDSFRCNECGNAFRKPLLATVSASGNVQTYYACPRCMTKVRDVKTPKTPPAEVKQAPAEQPKKRTVEHDAEVKCTRFFGYLKKRGKDTPVPEDCLTCSRMVECLLT